MKGKIFFTILVILILVVLGVPVLNLATPNVSPAVEEKMFNANPGFRPVAEIFAKKCQSCHSQYTRLPWYSPLPVAGAIIEKDVRNGQKNWDISNVLTQDYGKMNEIQLAKLEAALYLKNMPPVKFSILHWNTFLNEEDKNILLIYIKNQRTQLFNNTAVADVFKGEVVQPVISEPNLNQEMVDLGNSLYHDKRLSGDETVSCASCHGLDKGGTDQAKTSTGIKGQVGGINAPTVFNSNLNVLQFWDGRAKDLIEQAQGPVENPIEMGAIWEQVILKLKNDQPFVQHFEAVMKEPVSKEAVAKAIAIFESSLKTPDSKFDLYLKGQEKSLTEDEIKGYQLFKNKGCISCHFGEGLGGAHFEKMGRYRDYFSERGDIQTPDFGRFNFTKNEEDKHYFKVPLLRNIAITFPYFHDGSEIELDKAVKVMSRYQLVNPISEEEIKSVALFLKILTGTYNGKPL